MERKRKTTLVQRKSEGFYCPYTTEIILKLKVALFVAATSDINRRYDSVMDVKITLTY